MSLGVRFWGTRGSVPAPLAPAEIESRLRNTLRDFSQESKKRVVDVDQYMSQLDAVASFGVGGHTSCTEVFFEDQTIIIDAGTGLIPLSQHLMRGDCGQGRGKVDILMTHFHWDHIIGLPFFTPIYIKGNKIRFFSVQQNCSNILESIFKKPFFPVNFTEVQSQVEFHNLNPRSEQMISQLSVTPYQLDHPDECWGFKIKRKDKSFSYCADTEGIRTSEQSLGEDLALYQNVNVMAFDAQYSFEQSIKKHNWGHASAVVGLDIALRQKIPRLLFIHHDPYSSDEDIVTIRTQVKAYHEQLQERARKSGKELPKVSWEFVREGHVEIL